MTRIPKLLIAVTTAILSIALTNCGDRVDPNLEPTPVNISLEPEIDWEFDGNRSYANGNAEVLVDGELVSNSLSRSELVQIHLPQGSHTLTVLMEGYEPSEKKIRILDTHSQTFVFKPNLKRQ